MNRWIAAAGAGAFLYASASAQSFNIDVHDAAGVPSAAYGAAAGQTGTWNSLKTPGPTALTDVAGATTSVTATANSLFLFSFDNPGTMGEDEALLDDVADGARTWTFANLANGTYDVHTYAWAPDSATFITNVSVNGGPAQGVGGAWTGAHQQGVTYASHTVHVTGGSITVQLTVVTGFATTNGFQLGLAGAAGTDSFNVDLNDASGVPAATHGAGAGQAGFWNNLNAAGPTSLTDTSGSATAVMAVASGFALSGFDNPGTAGDDEALMDDVCDGARTWSITGVADGTYDVYTYAWAPDSATFVSSVSVNGGAAQTVGGAWPGGQQQGVTYAKHSITVAGGAITIDIAVSSGSSSTNGFQIVKTIPPPPPSSNRFNVDVDNAFGVPSSAYGAAAGQPGTWNSLTSVGPTTLLDTAGATTGVTVTASSFAPFGFDNAGTSGDDEALMDDLGSGNSTWTIENLPDGTYDVYTYAWAPDNATYMSFVRVNGGNPREVGGSWPGGHQEGVTYALHTVPVSGGQIVIEIFVFSHFSSTNGFQIVGHPPCAPPATYCTAKTSSSGCVPAMGFTGTATPIGNLRATCANVEMGQLGVLFHGTSGPSAAPFQGGFLCVNPPVVRFPVQASGGFAACAGSFSQSLSSLISPAGTTYHVQWWFRDPGAASGTGLSDGGTFTTCP